MGLPGKAGSDPLALCPCVRRRYLDFIEQVHGRGIPFKVIETWRDAERQAWYLSIGTSRTLKSLHLPQPPNGLSLAFDIAPVEYLAMKGWNPGGELWQTFREIGDSLGLEGIPWDKPHQQRKVCDCPK